MKLNRKWLIVIALVLSLTMATAGTMAYLTDTDADKNTMTLGKVEIVQNEHQRAKDENGDYKTDTIDNTTSYVLEAFENDKPLLPVTELKADGTPDNHGAGPYDDTTVKMSQIGSYGSVQVFKSPNAQDKIVTVTNTGRTDAYVRTIIAYEVGTATENLPNRSARYTDDNSDLSAPWFRNILGNVEIDGNTYWVCEYVYHGAKLGDGSIRHENGILPAGDTTYPSLMQVYLPAKATNEDVEKLDGNNNGKYDVLVLSQAVQADGFDDAATALKAGFGEVNAANVQDWFSKMVIGSPGEKNKTNDVPESKKYVEDIPEGAVVIETADDFMALSGTNAKGTYYLANDIDLNNAKFTSMYVYNGNEVTFIGNGHTISNVEFVTEKQNGMNNVGMFHVGSGSYYENGNKLTIRNLTVENAVANGTTKYCDAGIIISYLNSENTVSLTNVDVVNGKVENDAGNAGLLIGYSNSSITLTDCDVSGTVSGERTEKTGGLVGTMNGEGLTATVTNCTNDTAAPDFGRVVNGAEVK